MPAHKHRSFTHMPAKNPLIGAARPKTQLGWGLPSEMEDSTHRAHLHQHTDEEVLVCKARRALWTLAKGTHFNLLKDSVADLKDEKDACSIIAGSATSQPRRRPGRPKALDKLPIQISFSYRPQKLGVIESVQSSVPRYTCVLWCQARVDYCSHAPKLHLVLVIKKRLILNSSLFLAALTFDTQSFFHLTSSTMM